MRLSATDRPLFLRGQTLRKFFALCNWLLGRTCGTRKTFPKNFFKIYACIEKGDVVSYELQGRLGLRRVVRVPRSAERKTGAVPRMEELFRNS